MVLSRSIPTRVFVGLLFLVGVFAIPGASQSGSVDLTFNAVPSNSLPSDANFQQIIQPDGKIIVYSATTMSINGEIRSGMFRLNSDGSLDPTFAYNNEGGVGINNVMLAPDGKLVVAGSAAPNHAKMIRLNPNGSLDNSFSVFIMASGPPEFTGNFFTVNAVQADGKVIATHTSWANIAGTWYSYSMGRYNSDASIDSSFTAPPLEGGHLVSTSAIIEWLPDGRFYLAISSGNHLGKSINLSRRFANGTLDSSFTPYSASIGGGYLINFADLAVTPDGGVLATGVYWPSLPGGPGIRNLLKFFPDGATDSSFASPTVYQGTGIHLLPDGKVLYSASGGTAGRPLMRLNTNGSVDDTYVLDPSVTSIKNVWRADPMNRPVFLAQTTNGVRFVRLLENGSIDPSFNPVLGSVGSASVVAVQPDGKVLVAGSFTQMNGTQRNRIARVNANGTLDTTFDPGTGFITIPRHLRVQPDGKIIAAGSFTSYNGAAVGPIIRLNGNGSIDSSFSTTLGGSAAIESVALQPDGKILIGGSFSTVNGVSRTGIARLESNGALDTAFNPVLGSPSINTIVVEPNGKITIGGQFTGVNGVDRNNLARLESNGSTDTSFQAAGLPITHELWRQPDGKYLVTNGSSPYLSRRNSDGSPDASFTAPTFMFGSNPGLVGSVVLQPDGSMIIGGRFNSVGGTTRWHLTRLAPNGAHDATFLSTGANLEVLGAAQYSDGKVMVVGSFTWIDNVQRLGIARVNVPALQRRTLFDFDGDGRADYTAYRPSSGVWYELSSGTHTYVAPVFGLAGDIPVPADFDGDGKTDEAIWRPSNGDWWYLSSVNGSQGTAHYGAAGDIPRPGDFDGDGKADFIVYRPSNNIWYRSGTLVGEVTPYVFGVPGDIPLIGDFDGDGKVDPAIFRPSNGDWWYAATSANLQHRSIHWGANGDIPAPADFDGDGKTDYAVFRPSNGGWYVYKSSDNSYFILGFGVNGDRPIPADYDGDGRADVAVFRPSNGVWYLMQSTAGSGGVQWGLASDVVAPGAFLP